jgi:hypothetical protein
MRLTGLACARAREILSRIERDECEQHLAAVDAAAADRYAAIRLLRRYGRSRSGLLGARVPQWRPDDGFKPNGWKRSRWEDRLIFCIDIERAIYALHSARHIRVLLESFALDRPRIQVARALNVCTRTLSRIENAALDAFVLKCRALGVEL